MKKKVLFKVLIILVIVVIVVFSVIIFNKSKVNKDNFAMGNGNTQPYVENSSSSNDTDKFNELQNVEQESKDTNKESQSIVDNNNQNHNSTNVSDNNNENISSYSEENNVSGEYKYAKDETLLRDAASSNAKVSIVIVKGTKLKYLTSEVKGDGTVYNKVEIVADNNYKTGHIGYVLERQTTDNKVDKDERLIRIKNKTKMVQTAMDILNTSTSYNLKAPYRVGGYYGLKDSNNTYVYDCSTFCSSIMNRVFGIEMLQKDKDKVVLNGTSYYNVWTTYTYFNEIEKSNSMFKVIDRVTEPSQQIDKSKLQIGDFIIGDAKNIRNGVNHIMFYAGDDYIIHAKSEGVVRERLNKDYYTKLESKANMDSGEYKQRFDKEIMIIRYRDKEL